MPKLFIKLLNINEIYKILIYSSIKKYQLK